MRTRGTVIVRDLDQISNGLSLAIDNLGTPSHSPSQTTYDISTQLVYSLPNALEMLYEAASLGVSSVAKLGLLAVTPCVL
jgi:hypothetical protein